MTHETWGKCMELNVYAFFNILAFCREYNKRQREINKNVKSY